VRVTGATAGNLKTGRSKVRFGEGATGCYRPEADVQPPRFGADAVSQLPAAATHPTNPFLSMIR
jgi:hypothetical protein